jgi:hypothetical protein
MTLNSVLGILISVVCVAATIVWGAKVVLKLQRAPWGRALVIAATANVLGKVLVSVLHRPAVISYAVPTLAFLLLSHPFFRPTFSMLIGDWLARSAAYLGIHAALAVRLGWTFMFPFCKVVGR